MKFSHLTGRLKAGNVCRSNTSDHHKDKANIVSQGWEERRVTNGKRHPDPPQGGNDEEAMSKDKTKGSSDGDDPMISTSWNYLTCVEDDSK